MNVLVSILIAIVWASGALTIIGDFVARSVDSPPIQVAGRLELPVRCAIQHILLESGCSELF